MTRARLLTGAGLVALAALTGCGLTEAGSDAAAPVPSITVAAASDLRPAFEELGEAFEADTGTTVTFSFGSSGQLREQIINGAPFDLFASANVDFVDQVIAAGRGDADTRAVYAVGRIALWVPDGTELPRDVGELAEPRYGRIAIANPAHAPYGVAAEQALANAGVREAVADRLVYGENIADTLRITESGNADAGIVAWSLAIAGGRDHVLVPDDLHEPIVQALVVTASGPRHEVASAFATHVASPAGREVMLRSGFAAPSATDDVEAPGS